MRVTHFLLSTIMGRQMVNKVKDQNAIDIDIIFYYLLFLILNF